jgi:tripartite-type tricarboxylate transporter receptor subunit TctC
MRFAWMMAAALLAAAAQAGWPERPVRLIVPATPGSSADAVARVIAQRLTVQWGQPVVVEAKPGAGGVVATEAVAHSKPDGYTLGWVIASHAINPALRPKLPYDTVRDLAGVTLLYQLKAAIVAAPGVPASNVDELVRWIRGQPQPVPFASPGTGTGPHLLGELFRLRHGLAMQHVPYRGAMQAYPDVVAGRVPLMFDTLPTAMPQVRSGGVKLLAVVSDEPRVDAPDRPRLAGLLPRDAVLGWNGIVVPARTPRALVAKLNADLVDAMRSDEVRVALARHGMRPLTSSPEAFDDFIRGDIARWGDVVRRAGVTLEEPN